MKIQILASLSGPMKSYSPGDEVDWDKADAIRLIEAGFAVPVTENEIETTTLEPATEKRVTRRPIKKSGE